MSEFKDLAVEGAAIAAMPKEKRWFEITEPEPRYESVPSLEDPSKSKDKLIISVKLSNSSKAEYYPNKTSSRKIANLSMTTNMQTWIGKMFLWGDIVKQKVGSSGMKDVLYVTDLIEKINDIPSLVKKREEAAKAQ